MLGCVLLCGSRSLVASPADVARAALALCPDGWLLISGGARGADAAGPAAARLLGWEYAELRPQYRQFGYVAPLLRDDEMVTLAEGGVIAVWDGHSRGTAYTLRAARRLGRRVIRLSL